MALKTFKSYTKSTRGTVLVDKKDLWKGKPLKSLTAGSHSTGGRKILSGLHLDIRVQDINKNIDKLLFIEKKMI